MVMPVPMFFFFLLNIFQQLYVEFCIFQWPGSLCSAWAIGTDIATPEVQANVLHLCILNCCQGKVPLGRPGNHASQHALCEWQEEGVTEWGLCVNGHLVSWTDNRSPFLFVSGAQVQRSFLHALQHPENNIINNHSSRCHFNSHSVQRERNDLKICCNYAVVLMFRFLFSGIRSANFLWQ